MIDAPRGVEPLVRLGAVKTYMEVLQAFHERGMTVLWYASVHPAGAHLAPRYGPRWHAGSE